MKIKRGTTSGFQKGHKKTGGRKKGTPNKFTALRDSYLDAFQRLGGTSGLVTWARRSNSNRTIFYSMLSRMLPKEVIIGQPGDNPETLPFRVVVEQA